MHILCPHCKNPIEVVKLSASAEISCNACGSSFHLEPPSTTDWQGGTPYLVSDFVEGVTLADLVTARRPSPREAAGLIATVAEALHHAHGLGVVHRDVKPSNIIVRPDGSPVVMDFGLAKRDAGEIT